MADTTGYDGNQTEQSKVVNLFEFIRELNKLRQKTILNYQEYPWFLELSKLPNDTNNIHQYWRDRVEDETFDVDDDDSILLSVHKPEFQKCPEPDIIFKNWLLPGWDDFRKIPSIRESISDESLTAPNNVSTISQYYERDAEDGLVIVHFSDSEERAASYENWLKKRIKWAEQQKILEATRNLFAKLYSIYFEMKRESETEEIIVANGILCDRDNPAIKHPVLTHRVKLEYDANKNTVFVLDTEMPSELYSDTFQKLDGINLSSINTLNVDLQQNDYHPLDRNDTPGFLKALVHQISSDSIFSESGIPVNWRNDNRFLLYMEPCYIARRRLDGTLKAIEQIIEDIQETGKIPAPIGDIVSGGKFEVPTDMGEESIEEQLAAVGGESVDILLSKAANREQLEIARRIENYNAVVVQGPPGTGKTHTIANLMGHFLAQGKSVLVTSHTTKALTVLKEKIVPELQNLCVSMLDDSNVDMERSVDGITNYMSKTSSYELKREMDRLSEERLDIIHQLADVRRKIFDIIRWECNCIVYNGEDISPSQAAKFVVAHEDDLSYIPGKVKLRTPIPLTFDQLKDLYRSNENLSSEDEVELANDLPSPIEIMAPSDFSSIWEARQNVLRQTDTIAAQNNWKIINNETERCICIKGAFGEISIHYPTPEAIQELKNLSHSFGKIEQWMKIVAVDGKNGGNYRQRWVTLINQIKKTNDYADSIMGEQFGMDIRFEDASDIERHKSTFEKLRTILSVKGKIGWFDKIFHKEYDIALNAVTINGKKAQSAQDCDIILHCMELDAMRNQCAVYWDELLSVNAVPKFYELSTDKQERIAVKWIPLIQKYLDWYQKDYVLLSDKLVAIGVPTETIFEVNPLDDDVVAIDKILSAIKMFIPSLCEAFMSAIKTEKYSATINATKTVILSKKRGDSRVCKSILSAITQGDSSAYSTAYAELEHMYEKYAVQSNRIDMLKTLEPVAPQWAEAIRERRGIHGKFTVPSDIEEAWKWKQLCGIVKEIIEKPFDVLQTDSLRLSKEYKKATANYAAKSSWYHLLKKTEADIDIKQSLEGWKQTIKKIGKGTGKQAPKFKAKARELMAKCQNAVPGWIMPINRALESLNPKINHFDVIIIDEASQSDVSSLAILYMGEKLIVVGDDKQVSPMAVGVDVSEMNNLQQIYIAGKIPNAHLYDAKTSVYEIAKTTFQPLMLREHFRCVPEIIGFSNMLSYDYQIKPLRDASSSNLLPAVVNYRVSGGLREGKNKTNPKEARAIIALMKACIEQPEYDGKSFGVISLLGNEGDQVKLISDLIYQEIDRKEVEKRNILCGNSANFQGDERDVIFLSMVDSADGNKPLRTMGFGTDDAYRKRYNVAASRARDQLWVVNSLDSSTDLQSGDIRKMLIDYSMNPQSSDISHEKIAQQADSPFEEAVARTLNDRGYHIVQQWKVGAYRLDMVAINGENMVAIECDGERWHSGDAKIREDMERQTILEHIGWKFIRIRGSEYYRDTDNTMNRVISELTAYGIEPEETGLTTYDGRTTELLNRVKQRAAIILTNENVPSSELNDKNIEVALNPKSMFPENIPKDVTQSLARKETPTASGSQDSDSESKPIDVYTTNTKASKSVNDSQNFTLMPNSKTGKTSFNDMQSGTEGNDSISAVKKRKVSSSQTKVPIQTELPGLKDTELRDEDIIALLEKYDVGYVDKRSKGGALWIIGGSELTSVVSKARSLGFNFTYKKGGGSATKGQDAWWTK